MAAKRDDGPEQAWRRWCRRIGWLAAIWAASVLAMVGVAAALRTAMRAAGLTS